MTKSEKRSERLTESLSKIDELDKFFHRYARLTVAERYAKHNLNIICKWNIPALGGDAVDYVAIFQRAFWVGGIEMKWKGGKLFPHHFSHKLTGINLDAPFLAYQDQEEAVFVVLVEVVDSPERFVPSMVRICSADCFERIGMGTAYSSFDEGVDVIGTTTNWESGVFVGSSPVGFNELPSEIVEGASQVIEGVPDIQAPSWVGVPTNREAEDFVSSIRLVLRGNEIWLQG